MVQSKASTVGDYLAELDPDRRAIICAVREVILEHLPEGYVETMRWGMITYEVPLSTFPDTYNGKPLMYCALAAQKRHNAVYVMGCYSDAEVDGMLEEGFRAAGRRLDRGKGCVRFTKLADLPLDVLAEVVAAKSVPAFLEGYRASRGDGT